jgi:hypothetical protein
MLSHLLNQAANEAGAQFATLGITASTEERNTVINRYYAILAACGQIQEAYEKERRLYLLQTAAGDGLQAVILDMLTRYNIAAPMPANSPLDPNEPIFYTDDRKWIAEAIVTKLQEVTS